MARIAKSLDVLRSQLNTMYPNRSKTSDGWIGDTSHAAGQSDHNPNSSGVVTALDITHDPVHGLDARKIAEALVASRDPRIKYVISNREINSSTVSPWQWRTFTGSNPHTQHLHLSVVSDANLYDSTTTWSLSGAPKAVSVAKMYRSLVKNGYFSGEPFDMKLNASVRYNNPGAINSVEWVQNSPGYAGVRTIGGGNPIAIFYTPEEGVALYWNLLRRYREAGAKTVEQIITRYGGGQDYSKYVTFVTKHTGLAKNYEIKLSDDDDNLLKFAKAMFRYEAGKETPLSDEQIMYGFKLARGETSTVPVPTPQPAPVKGFWEWLKDTFEAIFRR